MAQTEPEVLTVPLMQQYNKGEQLSVAYVYKLRPEELCLFFKKEHRQIPDNQGERRESLRILEKVGMSEGLLKCLATEKQTGIIGDHKDLHRRQRFFGDNSKKASRIRPYYKVLWEAFNDPTLKILLLAATLTLLIGIFSHNPYSWIEGVSIYFAVIFIALFASGTNHAKEKQFLKLDEEVKNEEVNVIRGQYGLSQPVQIFDIVVGDIILVETGMRIPADCILIEGMDITVDEAQYFEDRETILPKSLSIGTIEENNHTSNPDPFLLSDSLVMTGSGKAVVCAVGYNKLIHEYQRDEDLVGIGSEENEESLTPLQQRLKRIADQLSRWGYTIGFLIFVILTAYLGLKVLITDEQLISTPTILQLIKNFSIACAVVIVAVPEGLPLSISIAMAFSISIFKKDKLLVKKLEACENMGYITEICTGKTATLTKNDMSVSRIYIGETQIYNRDKDTLSTSGLENQIIQLLQDCIIHNCDSRVEMSDDALYVPAGNGTEIALLKLLTDNEIAIQDLFMKAQKESILETNIPFNPIRKRKVVAVRPNIESDYVRVIVKGAPEYVLPSCTKRLTLNGQEQELPKEEMERILAGEIIAIMAQNYGLRTLALAYRDYDIQTWESIKASNNNFEREADRAVLEDGLTFICAFGLNDDLREGVPEVIGKLMGGGVNVRMISGDNLDTAIQVAKKAGIIQDKDEEYDKVGMLGEEFRALVGGVTKTSNQDGTITWGVQNKQNFRAIAQRLKVLARATPEDKFALIVGLQEQGSSVAVTADGINDVGALKNSDVGFCMGVAGCQVAKEAADIILTDDNFKSVFRAAQWGRNINDNVRKFIQFQLTINLSCLTIILIAALSVGDSPFNVIQLLWMNMVMDTLAAISLATEPPHPHHLKLQSNKNNQKQKTPERVFKPEMWRSILAQYIYQVIVMIILLYGGPAMFDIRYNMVRTQLHITSGVSQENIADQADKELHYTLLFNTFMMMQLFNQFNCRKLGSKEKNIFDGFFNNIYFLLIVAAEFALQWFIVDIGLFFDIGSEIFGTVPQTFMMTLTAVLFGLGSWIVGIIEKSTPDHILEKLDIKKIQEEDQGEESDFITRLFEKIGGSLKRSETEKLLD